MSAPKKIYLSKLVMAGIESLDKPVSDSDVEYIRADVIRDGSSETPNDLEEAAKKYCPDDAYPFGPAIINRDIRLAFIAGAKWQKEQDEEEQADLFTIVALDAAQRAKEQMMKEAVEGMVEYDYSTGDTDYLRVLAEISSNQFDVKDGDKVRVIVLPKED